MNRNRSLGVSHGIVSDKNACSIEAKYEEAMKFLNFDVDSYQFEDLDLKKAASYLSKRDREILILHLMGHTQEVIGRIYKVTRSMISKRFKVIMNTLNEHLL